MEKQGKTIYLMSKRANNDNTLMATEIESSSVNKSRLKLAEKLANVISDVDTSKPPGISSTIRSPRRIKVPTTQYLHKKDVPHQMDDDTDEEVGDDDDDDAISSIESMGFDGTFAVKTDDGELIQRHLKYLYKEQKMCDLMLRNKEKTFPIHSFALTMHSDKYKAIFTESRDMPTDKEITLEFASSKVIEKVLEYMYTFTIEIEDDLLDSILEVSKDLDMKLLTRICLEHMQRFDVNNVLKFIPISRKNGFVDLLEGCVQFAAKNISSVFSMKDFENLSAEDMLDIFRKCKEDIQNHDKTIWRNMLEATVLWTIKNPATRTSQAKLLLKNVHFDKIHPKDMDRILLKAEPMLNDNDCRMILRHAFKNHVLKGSSRASYRLPRTSAPPRHHANVLGVTVIGGISNCPDPFERGTTVLQNTSLSDGEPWRELGLLPSRRSGHCAVILNGTLYVLGGSIKEGANILPTPTNSVLCYHKDIDGWTSGPSMNRVRTGFAACVVDDEIYVFGGKSDDFSPTDSVECYSLKTKAWSFKSPLPVGRVYHAACCHKGSIFVVGGCIAKCTIDSVDVMDVHANKWQPQQAFPRKICQGSLVDILDRMFYVGGITMRTKTTAVPFGSTIIYEYDDDKDKWSNVGQLAVPRHLGAIAALETKVFFIGGFSTQTFSATSQVTCYDICTRRFVDNIDNLPYPLMSASAVSLIASAPSP